MNSEYSYLTNEAEGSLVVDEGYFLQRGAAVTPFNIKAVSPTIISVADKKVDWI